MSFILVVSLLSALSKVVRLRYQIIFVVIFYAYIWKIVYQHSIEGFMTSTESDPTWYKMHKNDTNRPQYHSAIFFQLLYYFTGACAYFLNMRQCTTSQKKGLSVFLVLIVCYVMQQAGDDICAVGALSSGKGGVSGCRIALNMFVFALVGGLVSCY